ncbi:hypothetical protein [Borrelia coriaceae]|uniref:Uncharacterized protein n=1 Tax=Borrelia coriaceae ATCC 43381 TaxID=1408429 RepID=W5SWU1_9SPIR|nr:hypothetical protein [Borrelia coriaceae]AHH11173.1 hypothetical protein BCO_0900037 [Borrelia coriaceae ATCC 43381]
MHNIKAKLDYLIFTIDIQNQINIIKYINIVSINDKSLPMM